MIYIFGVLLIYTLIREKDTLFRKKRNMLLFLFLSFLGGFLGVVHMLSPHVSSLVYIVEKYIK